jgi:hypothetical protein
LQNLIQFAWQSFSHTLFALCITLLPFTVAAAQTPNQSPAALSTSLYGPKGVSPLAVRQGTLGSCFFHASLAAIAHASPSSLRNAIRGNAKTGYRVHFITGPDELVYAQDVEYARAHGYDRSEGEWVAILMRGFAQRKLRQSMIAAVQRSTVIPTFIKPIAFSSLEGSGPLLVAYDRAIRSVVNQTGKQDGQMDKATLQVELARELSALGVSATQAQVIGGLLDHAGFYEELNTTVRENGEVFGAYRSLGQGGIPRSVMEAFLGHARAASVTAATLTTQLLALHAGGTAIVAGSRPSVASFQNHPPDWYVPAHAYTILDYDPANRTVTLRNPWGTHPGPDGVFQLPLSTFQRTYLMYSYSEVTLP